MKKLAYIRIIAMFMAVLIISLPIIFAEEYSLLYDANGNLVYDQETDIYREYNELNQLIRTRINNVSGTILQEYVWDPIKEEIFIKDDFYPNGSLKSSTYYFGQDYIVIQNSSGTFNRTNIYQDGVLVGYEDFDGRKRYVLPDHEGSAHIILNESGDVIEENLFSPFAEPLQGVVENKFSYEAKEYYSLTKDYDFHFRKYDPKLRIFTQPDTLIPNVYDPQSLNRYSFERNNPYKYTDPDGHWLIYVYAAWKIWGLTLTIAPLLEKLVNKELKPQDFATLALEESAETLMPGFGDYLIALETWYLIKASLKKDEEEPKKAETKEDLKCKIINCDLEYKTETDDDKQTGDTPSTSNPSSQADSSKAISQSAQQNINQASGGYIQGMGYVTSGGATYPTSNPYFVPGTGNAPWGGSYSNVVQDPETGNWYVPE